MFNSSNTPSHKLKSNFFSNIRRAMRSNSQLTSVSESLFDLPESPKRHFRTAVGSPSHFDSSSSSYATSSGSSSSSSPASNSPSRPVNLPQPRNASSGNKIAFTAAEFMEDRYMYSRSPEKLCLSYDLMSEEYLSKDGLDRPSFFDVAKPRQAFVGRAMRSDGHSRKAAKKPDFSKKALHSTMYEAFDEVADLLPEFVYQDSSISNKTFKAPFSYMIPDQRAQSSQSSVNYHDPYCSEAYPSELGLDDSPTLGYQCKFPSLSNHSSPKENNSNGGKGRTSRSRIIEPGSLLIPCDFDYLSSILDTPLTTPQETFTDSSVGMAC